MSLKINRGILIGFLLPLLFHSFTAKAQRSPLEKYIKQGLDSNLGLQGRNLDIAKALYSLKIAKSLFLPSVSYQSAYQTGAGGRSISLPVGDLLNPVYSSLNQMIGSEKFPAINNAEQPFLPVSFLDAKVRTSIPILNTDLKFNRQIEQQKLELERLDLETFKLELIKNIKVAYYSYLSSLKITSIYESALMLAKENTRINERLLQNGKGLNAYVIRAKSEEENINARITESKMTTENAILYFNFLLNRSGNESIDTSFDTSKKLKEAIALISTEPGISNRPELKSLQEATNLNRLIVDMNKKFWAPKINGFLDLGTQAQNFDFNSKSHYYNAGIQLEVPLFSGRRNTYKIRQAQLDEAKSKLVLNDNEQKLQVGAATDRNKLISAYRMYLSSLSNVESAVSYHRLIERGFKEGVNSFIEEMDSRNLLTSAQLQATLNCFNVLIAAAGLERATPTK